MFKHLTCGLAIAVAFCATSTLAGTLAGDGSSLLGTWHGASPFQGYLTDGITPTGSPDHRLRRVYGSPVQRGFSWLGIYAHVDVRLHVSSIRDRPRASVVGLGQFDLSLSAQDIGTFQGTDTSPLSNLGTVAGQAPAPGTDFLVPGDSAKWPFGGVLVFQGGSTAGLAFSSPDAPQWSTGSTIDDGSVGLVNRIPTPGPSTNTTAPEPAAPSWQCSVSPAWLFRA